jgi:tetratricopeptide (TPR) repeat protein
MAGRIADIARAIGSDYLLADAEVRRGTGVAHRNAAEGIVVLKQALDLAESSGNIGAMGLALNNLAFQYMLQGNFDANLHYRRLSMEQAQRHQNLIGHMWTQAMMSQAYHYLGDVATARRYAETAADIARSTEQLWHTAYIRFVLGEVKVLTGEWDDAALLIEEGSSIAESYGDLQGMAYARLIGGELALLRGDPQSVVNVYERSAGSHIDGWERWVAAQAHLELGDDITAERIVQRMLQDSGMSEAQALRIRGMIGTHRGARDEAERDLVQALEVARRQKYRQEEGMALHELGILLAARGDRDGARERLGEALRLFRDMGAHAYADRTERSLSALLSG